MIKFELKGLDTMERKLGDLARRAQELDGKHSVSFGELFNPDFMSRHTAHADLESLLAAGNYEVNSKEDFEAIPDDEWDDHIRHHTQFPNWEEMQKTAAAEWMTTQLGF